MDNQERASRRFQVQTIFRGRDQINSAHSSYAEAEKAMNAMPTPLASSKRFIVDTSQNVLVDSSDADELARIRKENEILDAQEALVLRRTKIAQDAIKLKQLEAYDPVNDPTAGLPRTTLPASRVPVGQLPTVATSAVPAPDGQEMPTDGTLIPTGLPPGVRLKTT